MRPGVIGLGSMGGGAAASLVRAGFETVGCDVDAAARDRFAATGGRVAADPAAVAAACDVIALFVVSADQVEEVLFGRGVVEAAAPGTVIVQSATIPPQRTESIAARLGEAGLLMLDAPVSGGAAKAAAGAMSVMASGAPEAFKRAAPMLDAIAARVFRLGDAPGAGSRMKLVNQHLAGVHIAAAAEALVLAIAMGLDPHHVIETIRDCAGTSWMFENRGPHIADGDYAPRSAVDIWLKDLAIVTEEARARGLDPILAREALDRFRRASGAGWSRLDDAAVARVYAAEAGVVLPGETG